MTRFARIVASTKRKWRYRADRGDTWTWGKRVKRWVRGVLRYFYMGDCEDYCFRVIWRMAGGKSEAIKAIRNGEYIIWWATTLGDGGKENHAVVECVKTGEFADVIFGKAVKNPNTQLGTIRLVRRASPHEVLFRLGVIQPTYPSEK